MKTIPQHERKATMLQVAINNLEDAKKLFKDGNDNPATLRLYGSIQTLIELQLGSNSLSNLLMDVYHDFEEWATGEYGVDAIEPTVGKTSISEAVEAWIDEDLHISIDGNIPIYYADLDMLNFLHGSSIMGAIEDQGMETTVDNYKNIAMGIYCLIDQAARETFLEFDTDDTETTKALPALKKAFEDAAFELTP